MERMNEFTDETVLNDILRAVPAYLKDLDGVRPFDVGVCTEAVRNRLRAFYASRDFDNMIDWENDELRGIMARLKPAIAQHIAAARTDYEKRRTVSAISETAARALLAPAFEAEGFGIKMSFSRTGASVELLLSGRKWARFKIRYDEVMDPDILSGLVQAAVDLRDAVSRFGHKLTIGG